MRIMLCQTRIQWEDKEANIKHLQHRLSEAKKEKADIVCLPEMSFTGFSMNIEKTMDRDLETMKKMKELARTYRIAIGFGYVTPDEATLKARNHYAVVDDSGNVLGDYVKIHPFSYAGEDKYFTGGDRLVHFDFMDFHIGLAICYDLRFPEQFIALGDQCDLILLGANWPAKRSLHWSILAQARAIENQCYMAVVNCYGEMDGVAYSGNSMLIHPDGSIPISGICPAEDSYVVCDLINDVEEYRTGFPIRQDRRNI